MNKTICINKKKVEKKESIPTNLLILSPPIIVNKLFLSIPFEGAADAEKNIRKKLSGYRMQDKKKNIYNKQKIISYDELIEKMVASKMKCWYCRHPLLFFYSSVREPLQWTLDRIDNATGHNTDNVVIACLKCNLEKRCRNDRKFLFTKQMKIIKKN